MNSALACALLCTLRPLKWSVTPEVAGSSPVAPVKLPANRHVLLSPRAQSTAGFLDPVYVPHGSAVPSAPDRSSAATTLVRSRTHPASPFPVVVAPQQCETTSAAGCAAVEESPASVVRVFGDLTDRWRHRSCVALRRASTARTRRWASSL